MVDWKLYIDSPQKRALEFCHGSLISGSGWGCGADYGWSNCNGRGYGWGYGHSDGDSCAADLSGAVFASGVGADGNSSGYGWDDGEGRSSRVW